MFTALDHQPSQKYLDTRRLLKETIVECQHKLQSQLTGLCDPATVELALQQAKVGFNENVCSVSYVLFCFNWKSEIIFIEQIKENQALSASATQGPVDMALFSPWQVSYLFTMGENNSKQVRNAEVLTDKNI